MAEISAIVLTPDNYVTIRRLMSFLCAQTARKQLEIVIVVPSAKELELDRSICADFAGVRVVEIGPMRSAAQARAIGVRAATAPIVVLTEDHSFPEPEWAEALLRTHQQGWAAVGPAIVIGNPRSSVSWANTLIEYEVWLDPAPAGVMPYLPGHNSSYKRDVLLQFGEELDILLEAETILHQRLREQGYQLYLEPAAKTRHWNYSRLGASIPLRFISGRLFAAFRARTWSLPHRLLYIVGAPLIPLVRFYRIWRNVRRARRKLPRPWLVFVLVLLLLVFDAIGEMAGYALGAGDTSQRVTKVEFHRQRFMNEYDRQEFMKEG